MTHHPLKLTIPRTVSANGGSSEGRHVLSAPLFFCLRWSGAPEGGSPCSCVHVRPHIQIHLQHKRFFLLCEKCENIGALVCVLTFLPSRPPRSRSWWSPVGCSAEWRNLHLHLAAPPPPGLGGGGSGHSGGSLLIRGVKDDSGSQVMTSPCSPVSFAPPCGEGTGLTSDLCISAALIGRWID